MFTPASSVPCISALCKKLDTTRSTGSEWMRLKTKEKRYVNPTQDTITRQHFITGLFPQQKNQVDNKKYDFFNFRMPFGAIPVYTDAVDRARFLGWDQIPQLDLFS